MAVNAIVALPDTARRLEAAGLYPPARPLDAPGFQAVVVDFVRVWAPEVESAGVSQN